MEGNKTEMLKSESLWSARLHAKAAKAGIPLSGTFELTSKCNFNCKMCYVHGGSEDNMSADEWISVAESAKNAGMIYLLLTGGEPFVRKDFGEIYRAVADMGLMISINSNASLIHGELFELLMKHPPIRMNISLYACESSAYKALCGVDALEVVASNIKRIKSAGVTVKLNSSITPYNKEEIERLYAFAKENEVPLQATPYMFPPARIKSGREEREKSRLSPKEAGYYLLKCKEQYLTEKQLSSLAEDSAKEEAFCVNESETGDGMSCRGGSSSFWITSDGRMLPCGMFPTEGVSLKETTFEDAWNKTRELASSVKMPDECKTCSSRSKCIVCAASCITECGAFGERPTYVCEMIKEYSRLLEEKYL